MDRNIIQKILIGLFFVACIFISFRLFDNNVFNNNSAKSEVSTNVSSSRMTYGRFLEYLEMGWVTFYWHWKHMAIWGGNPGQFNESSNYIMGWLRDYLWLNSSPLINGYNPFGMNNLSVWAWMFLFGHLIWATGFMFLISWRGYWQELIETLVWAHERTPLANLIRWRDKPVALSIVQARLVGLVHFAVGYILTYAAFVIASTTGKFG